MLDHELPNLVWLCRVCVAGTVAGANHVNADSLDGDSKDVKFEIGSQDKLVYFNKREEKV